VKVQEDFQILQSEKVKMATETKLNPGFIIGLPPKKAIEYFQKKSNILSWNWWDVWQSEHNKVFTVAKVTKMDILQDIREIVQKSIESGITFRDFQKEIEPKLKAKGWWGKQTVETEDGEKEIQLGSPHRLRTIYQANLNTAYQAGRYKQLMDNVDRRPYWQYWAVEDSRTRPEHRKLNGKVFRYDDPFWKSFYPPNGFNCRCKVIALSERDLKRMGLKVESSEGMLSIEDRLVSEKTGEMRPVTVYKNPNIRNPSTGKIIEISPDVGWSYNPGETSWDPDLNKYPDDLVSFFNKDNPQEQQLSQKIAFKNIPGWQDIAESDTEEEVRSKAYSNVELLGREIRKKIETQFNRKIPEEYIYAKTEKEFTDTYENITGKKLDSDATGYCILNRVIGIHPNTVIKAGQGELPGCFTLTHESFHPIGRNNFKGDRFKEEGVTDLNTAIFITENIEGVKPEDIVNYLSKDSVDILLKMILRYNGDREKIIKNIKQLRTLSPIVAKAYTKSFKELSDEEFADLLKGVKSFKILSDDETDNYLKKNNKEKKEIGGKIAIWALKKEI